MRRAGAAALLLGLPLAATAQPGVWSAVGGGVSGPLADGKGTVKALLAQEDRLIVGGLLSRAGDLEIGNVAAWDGEQWDSLGGGVDGTVDALATHDGSLVVAGTFTRAGEVAAARVARYAEGTWSELGEGLGGWVTSLHVREGRLVAAGQFLTSGADSVARVAEWDGSSWLPIGEGLGGGPLTKRDRRRNRPEEVVYTLTSYEGDLVAGGIFTSSGERDVANVARWDGTSWQPMGAGLDDEVDAFAVWHGRLVAGGKFTRSGDETLNHIAMWDGAAWRPLRSRLALEPGLGRWALALEPMGEDLLVGGCFVRIDTEDAEFLATWDGTSWRPIITGMDHCIAAVARWRGSIYLGGAFKRSGLAGNRYLVEWQPGG